jgi:hypothetical protein
MPSKDRSKGPKHTDEPAPPAESKAADPDVEWPELLARLVEGVVTAELQEFEDNVMAFLDSAVADAYATFVWICARVLGAAFLLTGLVLFLGIFFQWWAVFGLLGVLVIAAGALTRAMNRSSRRRPRR